MIEMYLIVFQAECNKHLFYITIFGGDNRL